MKALRIVLAVSLLLQSGCGTLTGGFVYHVPLRSSEPGTKVRIYKDDVFDKTVWTPDTETLFPIAAETVRFDFVKDGYEPVSVTLKRRTNRSIPANVGNLLIGLGTGFIGFLPIFIIERITGAIWEFPTSPIVAQMTKTPEKINLEGEVGKIDSVAAWRNLVQKLGLETKIEPGEKEVFMAPLPREMLVGTWQGSSHEDRRMEVDEAGSKYTRKTSLERMSSWDFKDDGTYTTTTVYDGNACVVTNFSIESGTYMYNGGSLTLVPKLDDGKTGEPQNWRVDWLSEDKVSIRWKSDALGAAFWNRFAASRRLFNNQREVVMLVMDDYGHLCTVLQREVVGYETDVYGCTWTVLMSIGANGSRVGSQVEKCVESPSHYSRVSRNSRRLASSEHDSSYRIISCERESGRDFAYKFVIELGKDSDQTLGAFRKIQKEFRSAIQADYLESFPRTDRDAIHVDFPAYRLNDGKVEGCAVVLMISVTALTYDPNTRKGKLAVKVNANQYEEARKWIRKNIETLARDKNIALTTGEIPPAAKFYLGREELRDGNVLEIEFETE